jgi:type IV secretion system protein VirD4
MGSMNTPFKQWKKILADPKVIAATGVFSFLAVYVFANLVTHVIYYFGTMAHNLIQAGPKKVGNIQLMHFPWQQVFSLKSLFVPLTNPALLLIPLVIALVFWLWKVPMKLYQMRIAYRDINTGSMGTARFAELEELATESVAIPLDNSLYEGYPGTPQLHIPLDQADALSLTIPKTYTMKPVQATIGFDAIAARKQHKGGELVENKRDPQPEHGYDLIDRNKTNTAAVAGTQSGKTQAFTYPKLDLIMRATIKESVIVTDLKADMVKNTKAEFERHGWDVKILNLITPEFSMGYNPLELVKIAYWKQDYDEAQRLCNTLSYSIFHNDQNHSDPMWEEASIALCNALILAVCRVCYQEDTPQRVTMYTVSVMLNELGTNPDSNGTTALDEFFGGLAINDPAKLQYGTITFSQGITRSGIYTGAMAKLKNFTLNSIARLTSHSDMDIAQLATGEKPIALFICYPDYDDSNYMIVSTFLSQISYVLSKLATMSKDSALPRRVLNLYEEVSNIPAIYGLSRSMNVGLQRGILYDLVFQSIPQLQDKYGERGAEAILDACGNKLCILPEGKHDPEYFASLLGKKTIVAPSRHGDPLSLDKSYGESEQARDLMTAEELRQMRKGEWVLIRAKQRQNLDGNNVTAWPVFADSTKGYGMPFAYEYLGDRFNHPQTFEELNDNQRSSHADLDLSELVINREEFGLDPEVEGAKNPKKPTKKESEPKEFYVHTSENVELKVTQQPDGTRNIDVVKAAPHKQTILDPFVGARPALKGKERRAVNPNVTSEIKEDLRSIEEAFTKGQLEMLHNIVEHHMPVDRQMIFMGYETVGEMKVFLIKNRDLLPEAYRQLKPLFQIKEEEL